MIKRFEGSAIIGYDSPKFNDFVILLGPVTAGTYLSNLRWEYERERMRLDITPTKSQKVEGEATRILYVVPQGRVAPRGTAKLRAGVRGTAFRPYSSARARSAAAPGWRAGLVVSVPPQTSALRHTAPVSTESVSKCSQPTRPISTS